MPNTRIRTTGPIGEATRALREARDLEPDPLNSSASDVVQFVTELQNADRALQTVVRSSSGAVDDPEVSSARRRLRAVSSNVARQAALAGRRFAADRDGSLATLNRLFALGSAPEPPLDGPYRGTLVTTTVSPRLDAYVRLESRFWMPWLGKRFDAKSSSGDNIFPSSTRIVGKLFVPGYKDYSPYRRGLITGFTFATYFGPGVADPDISVLKLDYSSPCNVIPRVRSVLDELVQLTGDYYLGKAFMHGPDGAYKLAAFFALRKWRE